MTRQRIVILLAVVAAVVAAATIYLSHGQPEPQRQPSELSSVSIDVDCLRVSDLSVPPGGIPMRDLCNATLIVQNWQANTTCTAGDVAFQKGIFRAAGAMDESLQKMAYVDLNNDRKAETIVLIACGGQGWRRQVIVLGTASDGFHYTIGQVAVTTYPLAEIFDIAGTADGKVRVQVGDYPSSPRVPNTTSLRQWQTYEHGNGQFVQIDGQSLPANPKVSDLFLSATALTFSAPNNGRRTGTVTVTLRNYGSPTVPFDLRIRVPKWAEVTTMPSDCKAEPASPSMTAVVCEFKGLTTGMPTVITMALSAPADADKAPIQDQPSVEAAIRDGFADVGISPNRTNFAISFP